MERLKAIYGYCIIPKNTLLFRGNKDTSFDDCMFFATKRFVAKAFDNKIQVWKTKTDINVLFLVEYLTAMSWAISYLPHLYCGIFPNEIITNLNDLDIKHWDINRRNEFVSKLFEDFKISGWLTSLEGKIELEVCLFNKNSNSKQLSFVEITDMKNEKYFKDSLVRIKLFPTSEFYNKTQTTLNNHSSLISQGRNHYNQYKNARNAHIREKAKNDNEKIGLKHFYYDLRIKLKI